MFAFLIAVVVTIITGYLIVKKYKPHAVLIIAGLFMMFAAYFVIGKPLLVGKASTGLYFFDGFKFISGLFSTRTAGLGMIIMSAGGFSNYMNAIGASRELVRICITPLKMLKSPYLVMALAYAIGQILNIFIPSASGLGMLLMVTVFPILLSLGVSRLSAAAVICSCSGLDLGPASGNATLAAKNAGMDPATYFGTYQIPLAIAVVLVASIAHFFVQRYYDKKDNLFNADGEDVSVENAKTTEKAPTIYALLPLCPLALIMIFSKFCITSIKMDVVTAMILCILFSMLCEFIRTRDLQNVLKSIQVFFDGMGNLFAAVITLVIAGEVFAKGLTSLNAINFIVDGAHGMGIGGSGMTAVMTLVIVVASIVMGSGNAPFFAFAAMIPGIAQKVGLTAVAMILPLQYAAGLARNLSPITGVVVAVSGMAKVVPMDLVKRCTVPMVLAILVTLVGSLVMY